MSFLTPPWHLGLSLVVGDKDPHCEGARAETVQCDNHVAIMLGGPVITRKAGKVLFKVRGAGDTWKPLLANKPCRRRHQR